MQDSESCQVSICWTLSRYSVQYKAGSKSYVLDANPGEADQDIKRTYEAGHISIESPLNGYAIVEAPHRADWRQPLGSALQICLSSDMSST